MSFVSPIAKPVPLICFLLLIKALWLEVLELIAKSGLCTMIAAVMLFGAFGASHALGPVADGVLKDCVRGMLACAMLESPNGDFLVCDPVLESSISSHNDSHCYATNETFTFPRRREHDSDALRELSFEPDNTNSAASTNSSTTVPPTSTGCAGQSSRKVCEGAFVQTIHTDEPLPRTTDYTTTLLFSGATRDPDGNIPLTGRLLCSSPCPSLPTSTWTTTSGINSTTSGTVSSTSTWNSTSTSRSSTSSTTSVTLTRSTSSKTTSSSSSSTKTSSHRTTSTRKPTSTSKAKKPTSSKSIVVPPKATNLPSYSKRVGLAVGLGVGGGLLSAAAVAGIIALSSEQAVRQQAEAIIANASTGPPVGADAGLENAVGQATRDIWESIQDTVPGPDDPSKHWPIDLTQTSQLLAWFDNLVETTRAGARAKGKKVAPAPPVVPPNVPPGIPGLDENPGTVWRADSGVVDFNFVVRTAGYLDLKPGDRVKKIKYAGNGWLEGSKGLKRGKFPENAISPSSAATEVPKDVWSGEDGLVDGVGPQNIREWAMRDLARRRLGGMTGSAVEPGDFLRQQMKDEHNRATDYATTQKRREFYKGLINNPTNEPGNEYRRLVAWKQYIILKEVLKIIKRFDDEFKPEPPPVKPGPSPRPRPHPKPPKKCRPRWVRCPRIIPMCRLLPPKCPKASGQEAAT